MYVFILKIHTCVHMKMHPCLFLSIFTWTGVYKYIYVCVYITHIHTSNTKTGGIPFLNGGGVW